ncbi:MAG: hypothetical protein OXG15_10175, partial [Gammaproteobacteria bacterium]|nr:hypothetical protein [Gammaproteobacteria bacterium]
MALASEILRRKYDTAREERDALITEINERVLNGGDAATEDERKRLEDMQKRIDELKEDYEAQRDLEAAYTQDAEYSRNASEEAAKIRDRSAEDTESLRRAARDMGGPEALREYDERAGDQLATFAEIADKRLISKKLSLAPHLAHNFKLLRDMGVSAADYVSAVRAGQTMVAERQKEGRIDVRVYAAGTEGAGKELVPTFWDNSLYLFASYVGGVQNSGAEVIPLMGNNVLKLPKVTGYEADALQQRPESQT